MADLDRRTVLAALGGAGGALMLPGLGGGSLAFAQDKIYKWGSSSLGSTGYQIIAVLAQAATKNSKQRHTSLATAGGSENMALLREKQIDFGQTTSTDWEPAIKGTGKFKGKPVPAVQMFAYTIWQCTPMVRADSPIKSLEDLKGKRVMPTTAGGATNGLFQALFKAIGISDKVNYTYGSWKETYDAFAAGAVDCIPTLLTAGNPSGTLKKLTTTHKVRILPVTPELIKKAQAINPGVMSFTVDPKTFPSIDKPTLMLSFGGVAATRADAPKELVYSVVKAIFENTDYVQKTGGVALKDVRLDFATKYLIDSYPVHAGAAQYFKEKGVWREGLKIAG
ncbi:MAG: TAXI family TRAP transporter solute-binding subunit [Hyphomicrobiaceae bacterium]|nr:TAXI family TRAP transporter solute-binding subunit [Hyphomicrobiaceae bacterium]